jgi:metal-dependent amidase/aminoacylase/carboxypeptidase family protein
LNDANNIRVESCYPPRDIAQQEMVVIDATPMPNASEDSSYYMWIVVGVPCVLLLLFVAYFAYATWRTNRVAAQQLLEESFKTHKLALVVEQ